MFRIKLLFLLLPLAINVKAVELVNDHTNRPEPTWYENSLTTSYGHKSQDTTAALPTQRHVESLDSSNNLSPVPLRHVPKPISYGSFGIAKVLHTTPISKGEAIYVTSPSSEKLYSNTFSGAPLRILSTQPPHMHREESKLRDDVIIVDPKVQHIKLMDENNSRNEFKSNGYPWRSLSTSVERNNNNHFHESGPSAPLREVPKTYRYEVPTATTATNRPDLEVSEFVTHPSVDQKLENAMSAFKETEKPTLNEKIVDVTPNPNHNTQQDLTSFTELPTTVTVMRPNGIPLTTASLIQPQSDVTIPNRRTPAIYQDSSNYYQKELRLDFSCDGIDAFYSIAKNCDKFVECKDNVAKLYRCPPGLHFNPRTVWPAEPCDDKYIARCDTSLVPTVAPIPYMIVITLELNDYNCNAGDGYYSYESNCEQFIGCKGNVATLYACPPGLHFNNKTKYGEIACDIPSIAQCPKSKSKFSATIIARRVPDYVCPSNHGYFKIVNECEQFIKCERSIASSYKCLTGLQFNPNALWGKDPCESASVIRCNDAISPIPRFSAIFVGALEDYTCPSSHGYYKIDNNCEQFIKCEFIATSYKCLHGLQFNHNAKFGENPCAKESIIRCQTGTVSPEPQFSLVLVGRMESYVYPSSRGYFRMENDWGQFVNCGRFTASKYKCHSGFQFNHNAAWEQDPCASESIVRCHFKIIPPAPKPSAILISKIDNYNCLSSDGYYKIDNDCEQFIKCERSIASSYKCLAGLQFNSNALWGKDPCESASVIRCKDAISPIPRFSAFFVGALEDYTCPSSHGYYKIDNNCEQFIKCGYSNASIHQCYSGLQFNQNAAWEEDPCASVSIIGCRDRYIPPDRKFSATLVGRVEYTCPTSHAYYKRGNSCEEFIKCEQFIATSYKCLHGLQFNNNAKFGEDPCAKESIIRCQTGTVSPELKFSAVLVGRMESYVCPSSRGYFRMENDCEQFVKCERFTASKYKCHSGLQFNHNAAWEQDPCASESIVRCHVKIIPPAPKLSAILISKIDNYNCPSSDGYYKIDNDCEQFIKCESSIAASYKCHYGLQFNHNAEFGEDPCVKESIIRCNSHIIPPEPKFSAVLVTKMESYVCPISSGYFKIENDCEQFIKCEQSTAYKYKCFSGLQFKHDATLKQDPCASESIVRCLVKIIPPAPKVSAILISEMENYVCPSSNGYYRIDNDCKQFIKCERSIAYSYKCFNGLQFNHHAEWGEDPCAKESIILCEAEIILPAPTFSAILVAKMESYVCASNSGYYRIENDCEQFIKCERSIATKFKCFPGMQYNHKAAWGHDPCASESIVRCNARTLPPKYSAVLITRVEEYVCPATNGYYRLAANNCEQFVQCENSLASFYKCFTGLQFNHNARWGEDPCALPSVARCEIKIVTPAILINPRIDYICGTADGYFSKEGECEQFIECQHNVPSLYKCPSGLQFNSNARWGENPCASASVVRCQAKNLSYILIAKYQPGYTCPTATGYFSVKEHCEQFIECQNNVPSLYVCRNGLHFNRYATWGADPCATRTVARCEQNEAKTPILPDHDLCPHANGYFPLDNTECSKYVVCENGFAKVMPCPSGLVFNATLRACDWPVNVPSCHPNVFENLGFTCPSPMVKDGAFDEEITHFRYGESCKMYIACQEGRPRLLSCDPGRYFDEETRHCIDSSLVHNCKEVL